MNRIEVRSANRDTARLGWISCEHCGAAKRATWFVSGEMCFCSYDHLHAALDGPVDGDS